MIKKRQLRRCRLEQICYGDKKPSYDHKKENLIKINGIFYTSPKKYFRSIEHIKLTSFLWWDHKILPQEDEYPDAVKKIFQEGWSNNIKIKARITGTKFYDAVDVMPNTYKLFLDEKERGKILGDGKYTKKGFLKSFRALGLYSYSRPIDWVISENTRAPDGYPLAVFCSDGIEYSQCGGSFFWKEDIMVSMTFRAAHVWDLDDIYKEIEKRILQLREVS